MSMHVVFRTDSSLRIGTGHVIRCLTLAGILREHGLTVVFICRELDGHISNLVEQQGFTVNLLPNAEDYDSSTNLSASYSAPVNSWEIDAEESIAIIRELRVKPTFLIVDHYKIDQLWEGSLRKYVERIIVIDDLADRLHDCNILLDQNYLPDYEHRYDSLVPAGCKKLLGPDYLMLRPEFLKFRGSFRERDGTIKRVLIFLGGGDVKNYTYKVIMAIKELNWPGVEVDVIASASNPNQRMIKALCEEDSGFNFYSQVNNIAELIESADVAISAGGFTSYELAFMGLPSVLMPFSEIQESVSSEIQARGAAINLGFKTEFPRKALIEALSELRDSPSRCLEMTHIGRSMFDGLGAKRVADVLLDMI